MSALLLGEALQCPQPAPAAHLPQGSRGCVGSVHVPSQPGALQTLYEGIQEHEETLQGWAQSQGQW